ncbi:MAG: DMT family transporter [Pseudomonadota bacterium]
MAHPIIDFVFDNRGAELAIPARRRQMLAGLFLALSGFTVAAMMATFKLAEAQLSLPQTIFLRTLWGIALTLPLFAVVRVGLLPEGRLGLYGLRIALAVGALTCWLYSIAHLPLVLASALSFSKSLFLLWLAALFLSETITPRKLVLTGIGFLGVVLTLDPSATGGASLLPGLAGLVGAFLGGGMTVVVKRLASTEPTLRMMFYPHLGVSLVFAIPALLTWVPLSGGALGLVVAMAVFGSISQWCFLTAYRLGDLSQLAPVEYTRLVAAAALGFLVFA